MNDDAHIARAARALDDIESNLRADRRTMQHGETVNVVHGLFEIADALRSVARSLSNLGTGNASTDYGALEVHAMAVDRSGEAIACALGEIANELSALNRSKESES